MAITESSRHHLHQRLDAVLGPDDATTLMEHLPPVGWADVATKRDLDHLAELMDGRFARVDLRFEQVDQRFEQVDRRFDEVDRRFEEVDRRFDQIDQRFEQTDQRFDAKLGQWAAELRAELASGLRRQTLELLVAMATLVALVSALGHVL